MVMGIGVSLWAVALSVPVPHQQPNQPSGGQSRPISGRACHPAHDRLVRHAHSHAAGWPVGGLCLRTGSTNGLLHLFGWLVGTVPAGMALIVFSAGVAMVFVGLGGYTVRSVRDAEVLLPDHDVVVGVGIDLRARLGELLETRQRLITEPRSPDRERALKQVTSQLRELGRVRSQTD
jgi:hypothetical protein